MPRDINVDMIATVVSGLGELAKEVVFVGGAVTEFYIENLSIVSEIRQTDDVDCIIEIATRQNYIRLEEQLRERRFENDMHVICRWHYKGIIVDIMPTDEKILGFSNRWYSEGIANSTLFEIEKGVNIRILPLPYFIGCKLEAVFNRGMADLRLSKDLEDIVFLLNYGAQIQPEMYVDKSNLKEYISHQFKTLLSKPELKEAIFCVLPSGENDSVYVNNIIAQLKTISS